VIAEIFEHDGIAREDDIEPFGFGITSGHDGHDAVTPYRSQGTPKERSTKVHRNSGNEHTLCCERPGKKGLEGPGRHRDSDSSTPQIWLEEMAGCQLTEGQVEQGCSEGSQGKQALRAVSTTPYKQAKNQHAYAEHKREGARLETDNEVPRQEQQGLPTHTPASLILTALAPFSQVLGKGDHRRVSTRLPTLQ
jgi:hypothetical protein